MRSHHKLLLALTLLLPMCRNHAAAQDFSPTPAYSIKVMESFRQAPGDEDSDDDHGNCASIALIKAALATFGPQHVFKFESHQNGIYTVVLRNGDTVVLSEDDLAYAKAHSGFTLPLIEGRPAGNEDLLRRANFVYAVIGKRAASYAGSRLDGTVKTGIELLNEGYNVYDEPDLLGLAYRRTSIGISLNYIHANGYHAVYASTGFWDDYGKANEESMRFMSGHNGINLFKNLENINFVLVDVAA